MRGNVFRSICLALISAVLAACGSSARRSASIVTGGDPERGAATIYHFGCGSCHTIPGVAGAHGQVGPALADVGARQFIAGELENDPSNLERWIEDPHAVNEHTVMPTLGVKPNDAADIAAYLYSLN